MADKIFGLDFTDDTSPTENYTVSVRNGSALRDVTLGNLISKVTNNGTSKATPVDADTLPLHDSVAAGLKKLTWADLKATLKTYFDTLYDATAEADAESSTYKTKYVITPSVASNNLTVALKYVDGTDPSSTKKLVFRVGDAEYEVTAATSFTKNAATNWCNLGGAATAAKEVDLFLYAIGETGASAGLKFGFARFPYAQTMADFVNTATDQKYIAGSWTNFNATDKVSVIGRFRAQLSAGAGYTWSIPTANVVNRPIDRTEVMDFNCTITYAGGTTDPTSNTVNTAKYMIDGRDFRVHLRSTLVRGGGNRTVHTFTLPWSSWVESTSPANALTSITAAGIATCTGYMSVGTFVFYNVTMANDGTFYGTGVNTMA